ncbi:uncharacterized protein LOC26526525 [Drosophila erecta]|uniref:uncharacterized protein LOC26526525 n=1 Tax=Drosophila erecta TaxID=7220 RepID=UPI0007329837|nr:uncharacterized protein LOC26526525 [Drosophila erecta]KQS52474.1 uncharacterized protein Dere_GG26701 [Drosophila erecta]
MLPIKIFLFLVLLSIQYTFGLSDYPNYDSHSPVQRKIYTKEFTSKPLVSFTDLNAKDSSDDATNYNRDPTDPFHIYLSVPVLKTLAQNNS